MFSHNCEQTIIMQPCIKIMWGLHIIMEYKFHPMGNPINLTKETIVGWSDRASKAEEPQPGNSDPAGGIWSAGLSIHCQETSCTSCYEGRVARWMPFLSRIPKQLLRLKFCRAHRDWKWVDWSAVIFTNESKFIWWTTMVTPTSVEVLMRASWSSVLLPQSSMEEAVQGEQEICTQYSITTAHTQGFRANFVLQDDNDSCHRAKVVQEWMERRRTESPDLNPIENLWTDVNWRGTRSCTYEIWLVELMKY